MQKILSSLFVAVAGGIIVALITKYYIEDNNRGDKNRVDADTGSNVKFEDDKLGKRDTVFVFNISPINDTAQTVIVKDTLQLEPVLVMPKRAQQFKDDLLISSSPDSPFSLYGSFTGEIIVYNDSIIFELSDGEIWQNPKTKEKKLNFVIKDIQLGLVNSSSSGSWHFKRNSNKLVKEEKLNIDGKVTLQPFHFAMNRKGIKFLNSYSLMFTVNTMVNGQEGITYIRSSENVFVFDKQQELIQNF